MGLWATLTGRTPPKQPDLDALFALPNAAVTLETTIGLLPTGDGAVCYRPAAGRGFAGAQDEVVELLRSTADAPRIEVRSDEFGFSWLVIDHEGVDLGELVNGLHAVNTALEVAGFGPGLLCTLVPFHDPTDPAAPPVGLVYLYKQGTFYPFVPTGPQQRDNLRELAVRDALTGELAIEPDLSRWLALWGAPGL